MSTSSVPSLRLWPGVAALTAQWLLRFVVPAILPEATYVGVMGGVALGLVVLVWWLFFSRASRLERWGGAALIAAAMFLTPRILHESIATGMMGFMYPIYAIPVVSLALVAAAVVARNLTAGPRSAVIASAILAACGGWALLRTGGITGGAGAQLDLRWSPTPEERVLGRGGSRPRIAHDVPLPGASAADWPGFRGARRDSVVPGVRIKTTAPVELWRGPAGPGWSSFAVRGGLIYTQEQLGEFETVACYRLNNGEQVWVHKDKARFWESNAGPGPRGTPSLADGRVYTLGATGILNSLDAATGAVVWTRNVAADTGANVPGWGFTSSPLVVDGVVIAAASGKLAAYGAADGVLRWSAAAGGGSYGSPQLMDIGGMRQVVMLSGSGATSLDPADGKTLWKHSWSGYPILQPALADGGLLITTSNDAGGTGTRRLAVARGSVGWTAEERWTSRGLKPYFNDLVVHKGHAYGFDGAILSCIDLAGGERKWKGGRYGHGQILLLPDQDLLLVLSEEGEVALVSAAPDKFTEVSRFKAIEGKTWNHPVLAGGVLLVRNGEEMAAYKMVE
ncbi:MAG: alcohol dehydrogenase [Acidobacteria bacterium]|nr:alcohol dehydrogenase [Acidobacteriota bacterium]